MPTVASAEGRPLTVYVTAQVLGVLLALIAAWALLVAGIPVWGAVVPWLVLSVYLSRKRLPSEAVGAGLQIGAVLVVFVPLAPYLAALVEGTEVTAVGVATDLFGPALAFVVFAAAAYAFGHLLKRRASRKLTRRTRQRLRR